MYLDGNGISCFNAFYQSGKWSPASAEGVKDVMVPYLRKKKQSEDPEEWLDRISKGQTKRGMTGKKKQDAIQKLRETPLNELLNKPNHAEPDTALYNDTDPFNSDPANKMPEEKNPAPQKTEPETPAPEEEISEPEELIDDEDFSEDDIFDLPEQPADSTENSADLFEDENLNFEDDDFDEDAKDLAAQEFFMESDEPEKPIEPVQAEKETEPSILSDENTANNIEDIS